MKQRYTYVIPLIFILFLITLFFPPTIFAAEEIIFQDGFESGNTSAGGWTSNGTLRVDRSSYSENYAARIDDSGYLQKTVSTMGYESVSVQYAVYTYNYDANEYLTVQWSEDGNSWNSIGSFQSGWQAVEIDLGSAAGNKPLFYLRFQSNAYGFFERFRVDDVVISGVSGSAENLPPQFNSDPIDLPAATAAMPYSASITGSATDPDNDTLSYSKTEGPDWLIVQVDGSLSGTPGTVDLGLNEFMIQVSDGRGGIDSATLYITVQEGGTPVTQDPGTGPWVVASDVAAECHMDPNLLTSAESELGTTFLVVRYGKICHEYYTSGYDSSSSVWSATKTLGSVTVGALVHAGKHLQENGRKTGPLTEFQKADHWLDSFSYNEDATIAHILAMEAHNSSLDYGDKTHSYDTVGSVQINTLSDIINEVVSQDTATLGRNIGEFYEHYVADKLGFEDSSWGSSDSSKTFAYTWSATARDMARLGLLMLNGGVWNGERIIDMDYMYNMSHAAFEDGSTRYGYLTWLSEDDPCGPAPIHTVYPHGISEAPDCLRAQGCEQTYDVGVFFAAGLGGQYIIQHRGLDMVIVVKDSGVQDRSEVARIWDAIRPAVVALDPTYAGDEEAFCRDYGVNNYAPDLKLWEDGR